MSFVFVGHFCVCFSLVIMTNSSFVCFSPVSLVESFLKTLLPESIIVKLMPGGFSSCVVHLHTHIHTQSPVTEECFAKSLL